MLRMRPFALFFAGQIGSNLGDGLHLAAVTFLALRLGASPFELGAVTFCGIFPRIMLGPLGGALADRWNRLGTMIATDWVQSGMVLAIPILYFAGLLNVWLLAALSFALASCSPFFVPASKALLPEMVGGEKIRPANGLLQTTIWPAHFLGAGLIGPLQVIVDLPYIFFFNASSYALSALLLSFVRVRRQRMLSSVAPKIPLRMSLLEGYRALRASRELHAVVATYALLTFFWRGLLQVGLPLYVSRELSGTTSAGAGLFGLLMAVNGVGEMISSLFVWKLRLSKPLLIAFAGEAMFGVAMIGVAVSRAALSGSVWLVGAFIFLGGLALPVTDVPTLSAIQERIPEEHIAKVFSYWNTMGAVGSSLGALLLGALFDQAPVSFGFALGGVSLLLLGTAGTQWIKWSKTGAEPGA